ncbi:hypothetical protein [Saccharolobus caldissimus]|uniref:Uncharacterized protein n=1 Tax=Saccharolobus caldissimus TaxID=1702097 RepID=A0AAQ4CWT7_9CREN|nr:hypothetical protein [Saccharolobus caldissimus]BDC00269.1 hypothetical protein SACC_32850 [Saccharolobus caldissimus]
MEDKALIWMALAILALMLLAEIAYNLVIYVPHIVYPQPSPMPTSTISNMNTTIVFNPLPYYASLPTIVNSSALTSLKVSKIFISNGTGIPVLQNIVKILSMNASEVTPTAYFSIANLGGFYVNHKLAKNASYTIQPLPLNSNGTKPNMTQINLILQYYNFSPYNTSYPPSDNISINSLVYSIIDTYTVKVTISVSYSTSTSLASSSTSHNGNQTIVTKYYKMSVSGTVYLLANGSSIASNNFQFSYTAVSPCKLPYPGAPIFQESFSISGNVIVPPGVSKTVYSTYNVTAYQYKKEHTSGNITYICYYPTDPSFNYQPDYFNWYEYNVTVPVRIDVFNGTNPITQIGNHAYMGRDINANFSYAVWSSDPQSFVSDEIATYDTIHYGNFTIKRTWNAGYVEVIPQEYTQSSGNTINHYLSFTIQSNVVQPPSWIFNYPKDIYKSNYANNYGQLAYYYALYKFLYNLVKNNTASQYYSYINWEVDIFANEIALQMALSNSSYPQSINPYLDSLFNKSGNQAMIAMQPILIMSWGTYYHVFNGTYNVKKIDNWTYSMILIDIPGTWLNTTPYILLYNGNMHNTSYLTDPTNIEHSFVVFWWYNYNTTMYSNLPGKGQAITFYEWYPYNYNDIPIYFETLNQAFTIEYYNSTVYNYTKQP